MQPLVLATSLLNKVLDGVHPNEKYETDDHVFHADSLSKFQHEARL